MFNPVLSKQVGERLSFELVAMAKSGVPRPQPVTAHGIWLEITTNKELSRDEQMILGKQLLDALWNEIKNFGDAGPPEGCAHDFALTMFAEAFPDNFDQGTDDV